MRTDTQTKPPGWHGGPGRPAAHGAGPRRARPRREDRAPGRAARSSSSPSPGRLIWGRQGMITRLAARGGLQRGRFRLRRCIENNGGHTLGASRIEGRGAAPADETVPAEPGELLLYTAPGPWTHRGRARPRGSPATSIRRRRENHSPGPCKLGDGLGAVLEGPGVAALPENPAEHRSASRTAGVTPGRLQFRTTVGGRRLWENSLDARHTCCCPVANPDYSWRP